MDKGASSETLVGRNWILIRSGIDDFRDGKPPDFEGKFIAEGAKGISPVINRSKDSLSSRLRRSDVKTRHPRPSLSKSQICLEKQLPLQQIRRDHVDEVEFGLTQHPLALYSHLEEGMPPELFEEVVDLLDPAMNPDTESDVGQSSTFTDRQTTADQSIIRSNIVEEDEEDVDEEVALGEVKSRNPYKWILRKDQGPKDERRGSKKRATSPSQDEHIKKVTKDFCDWVSDLGGDSNNVEESTIMSLFASGYETKPALSVPIHVVELSNVPSELRVSAGISPNGSAKKSQPSSAAPTSASGVNASTYEPSWVKTKYGAWYLAPETWKVRYEDEPLEDPEELLKREMSESKKKSGEMDEQLAPLHGARAFREFLERSNRRKPDFMTKVSTLQDFEDEKNDVIQMRRVGPISSRTASRVRSGMTTCSASTLGFR
ncbi:protein FAM47E-like isoform X2 [Clavelina lepadiformis]|uniref:protein FAM47E-like isoform X2 n=1 Tax=Clavelina lepadiformis TaxID=159417 RepID=UPI004041BCF7